MEQVHVTAQDMKLANATVIGKKRTARWHFAVSSIGLEALTFKSQVRVGDRVHVLSTGHAWERVNHKTFGVAWVDLGPKDALDALVAVRRMLA